MKRIISVVLSVIMLLSVTAGLPFTAQASTGEIKYFIDKITKASNLKEGDLFQMGSYPQSLAKDEIIISYLKDAPCTMKSYGYWQNYTQDTVDMSYADISYKGSLYRKVEINDYRPYTTGISSSSSNSYQDENGYTTGNIYYFKWEPIVWQVLKNENDGVYAISKMHLDSQVYNNYVKNPTWEKCPLREWLNNDFYNIAFSSDEKAKIITVTHSNQGGPDLIADGGNDTSDNLWPLSYSEALYHDALLTSSARRAQGSDYAQSQGLYVDRTFSTDNCSAWWLRSIGNIEIVANCIDSDGGVNEDECNNVKGIRPAFKLNPDSEVAKLNKRIGGVHVNPDSEPDAQSNTSTNTDSSKRNSTVKLLKVKAAKKKFTATWKSADDVDGYQIQYSLKKNMKSSKKKTVKGSAKTKLTVKKLKSKKTYYVRIRAYKVINGTKFYSKWSAKKKVIVK